MKKILFGILTILGIGLSFCNGFLSCVSGLSSYNSRNSYTSQSVGFSLSLNTPGVYVFTGFSYKDGQGNLNSSKVLNICYGDSLLTPTPSSYNYFDNVSNSDYICFTGVSYSFVRSNGNYYITLNSPVIFSSVDYPYLIVYFSSYGDWINYNIDYQRNSPSFSESLDSNISYISNIGGKYLILTDFCYSFYSLSSGGSSCPESLIDVSYNNGNTSTITCDGINYITIDGLSTFTNSNVNYEYTPYMNINYIDENNQKLVESYDKSILYLDNGQFKKTYTGNNDWILSFQGNNSENSFSGYLPTFEITGSIDEVSESGNIFNNFAENSVKFTLSNIPSYIQYVIIIMLLFFVLGIIRKFKRR